MKVQFPPLPNVRDLSLAFAFLFVLLIAPAQAQDMQRRAMIERLFGEAPIAAGWFTPEFLAEVPADKVQELIESIERRHGQLRGIAQDGDGFLVRLERADVPTRLMLDQAGRIAGLRFEPAIPHGSLQEHVAAIAALPGETSVLVTTAGKTRASHRPNTVLAVGSAAKLAILKAVAEAAAAGRLAWDQTVALDPEWRSLPTGVLQDWPKGTPLTVATLANLMISISDNTATDALVYLAGRERVEATTRELFVLKGSGNDDLRRSWRAADAAQRRKLLDRIAGMPLPSASDLDPTAVDVEWFLSASELCDLLDATADFPALQINPGLARKEHWRSVAFKGGSEPGVLNYSTRLVAPDGATRCVTATWNHPGLDEPRLQERYRAILRALRG